MTPEALARRFHETYERLAPTYGYKPRKASSTAWEYVPSANKELMIAVASELLEDGRLPETKPTYDWLVQQLEVAHHRHATDSHWNPEAMAEDILGNWLQREEGLIHELVAALRAVDQNMDEDTRASDLWLKVITALARAKEMRV